jgi:hypothetical protein
VAPYIASGRELAGSGAREHDSGSGAHICADGERTGLGNDWLTNVAKPAAFTSIAAIAARHSAGRGAARSVCRREVRPPLGRKKGALNWEQIWEQNSAKLPQISAITSNG